MFEVRLQTLSQKPSRRSLSRVVFTLIAVYLFAVSSLPTSVNATDFTSTSFKVRDPVLQIGGGDEMSSTNFRLFGSIGQISIGTSSATSFQIFSGFLYFPIVSSPTVSATAGSGQVSLSWTAAVGALGWVVSGYNVGQSTTAGGPYTFSSSLGNVTSSTRTGLTNGTTYYFVVRAEDAFGNSIATSSEVSSTPVAAAAPAPVSSGGGGGGGGGILAPSSTTVILKGRAYPAAAITIFRDGAVIGTIKADQDANWRLETEVSGGIYTFSAYAIDAQNRRSLTTSFTTQVPRGQTTTISDIVIAPTIEADKSEVRFGNEIKFFGATYPQSQINVVVNSHESLADKTESDKFGLWTYGLDSSRLEMGDHIVKSQAVTPEGLASPFSESLAFRVGDLDLPFKKLAKPAAPAGLVCSKNGDINNDKRINIIDFSILLYFWNQRGPQNPCADINGDKIVSIFDFSIMLFWWTG